MDVVYILLFAQGIMSATVVYQPQNVVSVDIKSTAVITCVSREDLESGRMISWYHRRWRSGEAPMRVKSCASDDDKHKYICKNEKHVARLEISNVQITDSGVYYCVYIYGPDFQKFGNGTNLIVGDRSTSRSSIHILGQVQPLHTDRSLQLACVVLAAHNTVHIFWNISGTYHKGRIISEEDSDGTWTVVNMISLPKSNWNNGGNVTCEGSIISSILTHWELPGQGEPRRECLSFLIPVVIAGTLLVLMLSIHLIRTYKLTENKTQSKMSNNVVSEDEITYSKLNMHHLKNFTA